MSVQVSFLTIARTRLHKFRKNVISFPQDLPTWVQRMGLMRGFRVGDRVDSVRGPGDDPARPVKFAKDASVADLETYGVRNGCLVFPGTVVDIKVDGSYVVEYDCGGSGVELVENLNARMRMPWHPRELEGVLTITLRRNIAHGRALLEVIRLRWVWSAVYWQP